jgi:hypothetical protein
VTAALPAPLLELMRRGVSVNVASRDAALRPSLMRAMASDVSADGRRITLFLARSQSAQLLQDIASTGRLAVVFSEPATHLSVQLKAREAQLRPAAEADRPALERYLASMEIELSRVRIPAELTRALLAWRLDDLVAVTFAPHEAYDQTPGAKSGNLLEGAA